jgi:thioredoxin-dependent peroxiredoxin
MTTMHERPGAVQFRGKPATLVGPALKAGDPAPEFTLATADLQPYTLEEATDGGKRNALLIVVPSLDTPLCSAETSTFHRRLAEIPAGTAAFVVSRDLPFAQKRWATENGATGLTYLSDFREHTFGPAYGVLLKDLGLLARAIFLIGRDRTLSYVELVPDVATEPDYDRTFAALGRVG